MAAEAAPTALVVATRAAVGCCGPGHVFAPQRTALEDGQGPGRGRETNYTAAHRTKPLPQEPGTQYYNLNDECVPELSGMRPAALQEPRSQAGDERHGGVGWELVINTSVPQLGRDLGGSSVEEMEVLHCLHETLLRVPAAKRVGKLVMEELLGRHEQEGGGAGSSNKMGRRRKKRKRRKKKLPKGSSSSFLQGLRGGAGDQGIMHEYADGETEDVIEYVQRADGPWNIHTVVTYTLHC